MGWEGIHWGTVYSSEIFFCMILVIKLKLKAIQVYVFVQNSEMRIKQQKWHLQMNWWNNILNTIVADLAHCEGTTDQPWPFTDVGTQNHFGELGTEWFHYWIMTSVGLGSPWGPLGIYSDWVIPQLDVWVCVDTRLVEDFYSWIQTEWSRHM